MAEERIAIYETESKIIEGDYGDFYNTISRTQAIERMALGMFEYERPGCKGEVPIEDVWQDYKNHYTSLAESALDALIKKG